MNQNREEFLWCEKYRPKEIDDVVLPENIKKTFKELIEKGDLPNMIFSGTSGIGKTSVAKLLCNKLNLDYIIINGSDERNIDTLRGKIRKFASTVSLLGGYKVVILDEADFLNPNSTQPALRGFIEEFSKNCRFIFTCNYKNKLIEAIHSRCSVYDFNTNKNDMKALSLQFFKRLKFILNEENVEYDKTTITMLFIKFAPDWRRILNECQRYSASGKIDSNIFKSPKENIFDELFLTIKKKDFKEMRKLIASSPDVDSTSFYKELYNKMNEKVKPQYIPPMVLILAKYQYQDAFSADKELNCVACLTEIMMEIELL